MQRKMEDAFTILIDGKCSLCRREARFMQRLDGGRGRLRIADISAPGFDAAGVGASGVSMDALMGQIHGVGADGELLTGMEVFRRAYAAVARGGGLWSKCVSAAISVTGWPLVRPAVDAFYRWFARNRMWISARAGKLLGDGPEIVCEGDRCRVP